MPNVKYVSYEFSEGETYFKVVLVLENGETYIKSGPSSFNDLAQIAYFSYIKELNSKKIDYIKSKTAIFLELLLILLILREILKAILLF